ncbi:unnamed protein product [Candidula unifasciata]|uniref:LicD/FKTN/FKRP nucleotidyltransferase domain-containing protein n=1 Tax=Candidula unifasciata TaxID=100452 RepID=A0A8S4A6P1_9EUPU|nr:unnamed protein product [Candidula unifasciata]
MTENNITYMMYGGTLIGSYRHHGPTPWDDDVDFILPLAAQDSFQQAFSRISHEYTLKTAPKSSWKIFSVHADPIRGCKWRWPFLDIFFFAENQTHIWDVSPWYYKTFSFPKTIIFPLTRRPFMNLTLPAPHNPRAVLNTNYDIGLCQSLAWNHRLERPGHEVIVPCSLLFSKFAFVQRVYMNEGCNETLVQNGEIVSYFFDEGQNC